MRFGDGAGRRLDDVTPACLARVEGAEVTSSRVLLHVFSRLEVERRAALHGHGFAVELSSPAENVFRVRVRHHLGRREVGPRFQLEAQPQPFSTVREGGRFVLRSGALELSIDEHPWALRFADAARQETLTTSPYQAQALMAMAGVGTFLREQLTLGVGEQVYGLGERSQAFARNGQSVEMSNAGSGSGSDEGQKDVPFFLTSKGYGVFVNSSGRVSFEIGTERVTRAQFAVPGEELDYFFILGPTPKQVLARYGALAGRPALPPAWSFGLWLGTSSAARDPDMRYDEKTLQGLAAGLLERDVPLHVLQLDRRWMKAQHGCNFRWDEAAFPDPAGMLSRLRSSGLHVCLWITPCIGERSHLFEEGARRGYLLKRPNGDVWQGPGWQAGMGYVDFTNPDATRWFQTQLRELLRLGVDCLETAFEEQVPTDVVWFDGSNPEHMHNHYACLYGQAVFELIEQERGKGQSCVVARSATATCQRFPLHSGGEGPGSSGSYEAMAEALRGGLSLGLGGFGFWGHDVPRFESAASASVYKRWLAFALLSSHSCLQASTSARGPWLHDAEARDVLRQFTQLKCRLMPYLMATAAQARDASQPLLRAMLLEFPEDPTCRALDRQYMLGDGLLVAPVFHDCRAEYYLPQGSWCHLLTGESREGGRWFFDELDFLGVPAWVRQNTVVCVGSSATAVDYDLSRGVRLVCGKLDGRVALQVHLVDGEGDPAGTLEVYHDGRRVRVRSQTLSDFQVHLPWAPSAAEVERGSIVRDDARAPLTSRGVVVRADSGTASFSYAGSS